MSRSVIDFSDCNPLVDKGNGEYSQILTLYNNGDLVYITPTTAWKLVLLAARNGMKESALDADSVRTIIRYLGDGWISVKERMPESDSAVITYSERYGIDVDYYNKEVYQPVWKEVTHWMPLPQPPEE